MRRVGILAACGMLASACSGPRDPPEGAAQGTSAASSADQAPRISVPALGVQPDSSAMNGEAAFYRAEYDSAIGFLRLALERARARRDTAQEAHALTWLGLAAMRLGNLAQARSLGEQALGLKLRAGLQADLFRSYNALGLVAKDEGRLDSALVLYGEAAAAARDNGDRTGEATSANNQALVYATQGRFAQARAGFVQARDAYQSLADEMREGRALTNLGMLNVQLGDPRSAITLLERARVLLQSAGDRAGYQNALGQLGTAYDALGEPSLAIALMDSALRVSRQHNLPQEEADNLEVIAGLHRQAGDLPRALDLYGQANLINGALGQTLEQGINLRNAAEIQAALGRSDIARENAVEALGLHRTAGAALDELRDRLLLADLAAAGSQNDAVGEHLRAADRLSAVLGARVARVEVALAKAAIADRAGDSRGVLRTLKRADEDLSRGGFGGAWQAAALMARAYARLSLLDSAAAAGRRAVAAAEKVRGSFTSGILRSSFVTDKAAMYGDLVETLLRLNRIAEAFEVADAARSHALLEHLTAMSNALPAGATVRSFSDGEAVLRHIDTLVASLDALEETRPAERSPGVRRQSRVLVAELNAARSSYETLLSQAADRDAAGAALLGGRRITAAEVQRALQPDEAMLEYLVTPARLVVFVVTRQEVRSLVVETARDDLARRVRLARDLLGEPASPAEAQGEVLTSLHGILMAPIERAGMLRGVGRVIVVSHSVLAYLPFSALKAEGTGRYVMEEYSVLHLPSAAALGALRRASPPAGSRAQPQATAFAPFPRSLPGSARETRVFLRAVPGGRMEEGGRATEPRVRQALSAGGIVHLATHGIMNPRNPMFSRIELAPGGGGGGANDDGRLEVHELLALRLNGPLVFLSGCDTGLGASWSTTFARGDDYATLAQAFLYAGARTVAATLWRIGDEGAAAFAERFYVNLRTMAPAEAIAQAQRELLRDSRFSSPYYWAGYQLFGASDPAPQLHSPSARSVQR